MPTFNYKCDNCKCINSYNTSVPSMNPPEICPECKKGSLEKLFTTEGQGFDIVGYCYANEYGKKNWKKNLSQSDQRKVLNNEKNPY